MAAGIAAGHILECGAQATGGNYTDWQRVPSMLDVGYPIVEAQPDGAFVVTKHPGTGGVVNRRTVTEQLLYEIGDPRAYLTPDVAADFTSLQLTEDGPDRVRVSHVRGTPPPATLKVSMVYKHGYRAVATVLISGPNALAKGERLAEMVWHRVGTDFADRRTDFIGYRACWGGAGAPDIDPNEIVFRIAVADGDRKKLERFSKHVLGFALQGPPGLGIFGGRPDVQQAFGFWPALVPRDLINARASVRKDGAGDRKGGTDGTRRSRHGRDVFASQRRADGGGGLAATVAHQPGEAEHHRLRPIRRQGRPREHRRRRALARRLRVSARGAERQPRARFLPGSRRAARPCATSCPTSSPSTSCCTTPSAAAAPCRCASTTRARPWRRAC